MSVPLYYNFDQTPYWNSEDKNDNAKTVVPLAPWSQDFAHGYDAHGRLNAKRRAAALGFSNANFCDGTYKFPLFLNQVQIDFALSGTVAQSQLTRDYYPHNMVLPGFQLQGQCYDQVSYGELCEFIHIQQQQGITGNGVSVTYQGKSYSLPLVQLYIKGNVRPAIKGHRPKETRGVTFNGKLKPNQSIKGQHETILCLGYIMSMPREHQTGDYAPTYTLSFMISHMLHGPYADGISTTVAQSTWVELLTGSGAQGYGGKADMKENKQVLKYAAAHAGDVQSSAS